jgi:uncharacterized protein (TIGR00255 family)
MVVKKKGAKKTLPLRSMTGFGVGRAQSKQLSVEVEIKSANSRYLDLIFRLPRNFAQFEPELRAELSQFFDRGRIEISANRIPTGERSVQVTFNKAAFSSLAKIFNQVGKEIGASPEEVRRSILSQVLGRGDVLEITEIKVDLAKERALLLKAVREAMAGLTEMRIREGAHLERDIKSRISRLDLLGLEISQLMTVKPEAARQRLLTAIKKLQGDAQIDPQRLHLEIALLVDRTDVTEEIVRLKAHLEHFTQVLSHPPSGKKLDFLIQELVREFNTIGSKAQDAQVQSRVVEAKSELEKIREQVQNLE